MYRGSLLSASFDRSVTKLEKIAFSRQSSHLPGFPAYRKFVSRMPCAIVRQARRAESYSLIANSFPLSGPFSFQELV
jgi:hypothetical protein